MTRPERLLAFFDLPYVRGDDGVRCQDAFWIFLERLGAEFESFEVLGRVTSEPSSAGHRCARAVFHALPQFSSEYALGEVLRGVPALLARAWGPVGRCDALLLGAPSIWSLCLWALGRLRGKRVAFVVRQDMPALVTYRAPARGRRLTLVGVHLLEAVFVGLSRFTPTFAVGDAVAARYRGAGGRAHSILISTVPEAALPARVTRETSDSGAARLLWVGRVDPEKRLDLLLASFRELCDRRGEKLALDVVGRGPLLAGMEELAERLGFSDRVRFHGYVASRAALTRLYESADLFVHSSVSEGFPQVILEAMASGVPVVTTAVGGIPSLLADGVNVLLVPAGDPSALTAAIERALDAPELRARLAAAGLELVRAHTLELESARLLQLWDSHRVRNPKLSRRRKLGR